MGEQDAFELGLLTGVVGTLAVATRTGRAIALPTSRVLLRAGFAAAKRGSVFAARAATTAAITTAKFVVGPAAKPLAFAAAAGGLFFIGAGIARTTRAPVKGSTRVESGLGVFSAGFVDFLTGGLLPERLVDPDIAAQKLTASRRALF